MKFFLLWNLWALVGAGGCLLVREWDMAVSRKITRDIDKERRSTLVRVFTRKVLRWRTLCLCFLLGSAFGPLTVFFGLVFWGMLLVSMGWAKLGASELLNRPVFRKED